MVSREKSSAISQMFSAFSKRLTRAFGTNDSSKAVGSRCEEGNLGVLNPQSLAASTDKFAGTHHSAPFTSSSSGSTLHDLVPNSTPTKPREVYNGGYKDARCIRLRIACGGAGEQGLIGAWADAFIQFMVDDKHLEPFQVAWYLGDTTDSLGMLEEGCAAEKQCLSSGVATRRGHFLLVGPKSNPAALNREKDDVLTMFSKITAAGKADVASPPTSRSPVKFLSRFDKSATNIKESELFIKTGQAPWACNYSKWYHLYPEFPEQALRVSALLGEYTLTDRGALLTLVNNQKDGVLSPTNVGAMELLEVFKDGRDEGAQELLLPCHALLGAKVAAKDLDIAEAFLDWLTRFDGGRKVVREFKKCGEVLYDE
ncbi:hypothetical protein DFP72DRAFT_1031501 [Ephemerocybe angulata]|uniref:Uncharacterized protein n=1 Tax=Ephemerocybe angulata TaxID=980116 RepID=A0A8H6MA39_9AGAR|nr:hypothetical protein DFP72DRAFT_1031501 [Tulosesus angulatus]